jgi:hypothetical protein
MWLVLLRRHWKIAVGAALAIFVWWRLHALEAAAFKRGYQQAVSENAKALDDWRQRYDAQVRKDEERIASAHRSHELELAQLAALHSQPLPRIVCRRTDESRAGDVSAGPGISGGTDSAAGVVPPDAGVHADIVPALFLLVERADRLSADTRELNSAVHGE